MVDIFLKQRVAVVNATLATGMRCQVQRFHCAVAVLDRGSMAAERVHQGRLLLQKGFEFPLPVEKAKVGRAMTWSSFNPSMNTCVLAFHTPLRGKHESSEHIALFQKLHFALPLRPFTTTLHKTRRLRKEFARPHLNNSGMNTIGGQNLALVRK